MSEIAKVAMTLFARDGFSEVTVDQIADEVGISPRTFFRYFATKEDVVFHQDQRLQARLVRALEARPATEGPITALRESYLATSTVADADRAEVLAFSHVRTATQALKDRANGARAFGNPELVALVAARMGIDPDRDPRPAIAVVAMGSVASMAFQRWIDGGGAGNPADAIREALNIIEGGLTDPNRVVGKRRRS